MKPRNMSEEETVGDDFGRWNKQDNENLGLNLVIMLMSQVTPGSQAASIANIVATLRHEKIARKNNMRLFKSCNFSYY